LDKRPFGDATGIGFVDTTDAMFMLQDFADIILPLTYCGAEDVDCDGDRDVVDALKILRWVAGMEYSQVQPCPAIGEGVSH
jgi:hypothetical protein